jgi:hypothetical protein
MRVTVNKFRSEQMPSKFGGTWNIVEAKFNETGEDVYQLKGFSGKFLENLKQGDVLIGYVTKNEWQGKNGPGFSLVFNKISAEYVYSLLLKLAPDIEGVAVATAPTNAATPEGEWNSGGSNLPDNDDASF